MKSAKIKPLSPIMERHTPQHPLPEEIKKLPQDETVCQFCGVSYLIHHEIKKLEDLVAQLEEELEEHHGAVEREQKLRKELEKNKSAMETLNQTLREKDITIEKITEEIEQFKLTDLNLRNEVNLEKTKQQQTCEKFKMCQSEMRTRLLQFQTETRTMKSDIASLHDGIQQLNNASNSSINEMLQKLPVLTAACIKDFTIAKARNTEVASNLKTVESDVDYWKSKAEKTLEELAIIKHDFRTLKESQTDKELALQHKVAELDKSYRELTNTARTAEMQTKSLQAEAAVMDEKLRKKQTELQNAVVQMQRTEESANHTIERLNRDCRDLERELASAQGELRKMRSSQKERELKEQELNKQASLSSGQMEELSAALNDAKTTAKALMDERELMISSHQNQIHQLRESFKRKLEASENLPIQAQRELQQVEENHRIAMSELERRLREELKIEMSVEKDKHSEALLNLKNKYRMELRELDADLRREVAPYKNQVATLQQKIEMMTTGMQEKKAEFEEERSSLKNIISQLENRIMQLTGEQEDESALTKLQVIAVNQKIQEAEKRNEELERKVISMKDEICLLQDTVRRECEERFELTEALSQAREQIKHKKIPNSTSSSSLTSNPVSALNKLNPNNIEHDSARLSSRTLRNLEMDSASPRASGQHMPSLRSLPDVLPRHDLPHFQNSHKTSPSPPYETTNLSPNVKDLSFGGVESQSRRSNSGGSQNSGQNGGRTILFPSGGTNSISQSKSTDSVDTVRRRIAAAIKRK